MFSLVLNSGFELLLIFGYQKKETHLFDKYALRKIEKGLTLWASNGGTSIHHRSLDMQKPTNLSDVGILITKLSVTAIRELW